MMTKMTNPFGGDVFGAMWEAATSEVENRAKEAKKIMKDVINKDTGALADSVDINKLSDSNYLVGVNETKLITDIRNASKENYVKYYYYGTKAHPIDAGPGKMLRFVVNGNVVYRKSVNHPGTDPHNFIQDTIDRMRK